MGKRAFIIRRTLQTVVVFFIIASLLFLLFRLAPGDPTLVYLSPTFSEEMRLEIMRQFGLDQPLYMQYLVYMKNLFRGELGQSFHFSRSVASVIQEKLANTIILMLSAIFLAYCIGITAGACLAWQRGKRIETVGISLALITRAAPAFWTGMIALAIFSFQLGWFPGSGMRSPGTDYTVGWWIFLSWDFMHHLILPATVLGIYFCGLPLLIMRSSMLEVMGEDFIDYCRIKGLKERVIMFKHAARNALLPVITALALAVGFAVGGSVVIETVFSWPGIGRMLVQAVQSSDYPVAQGGFLVMATIVVLMNFVADLLYGILDPRISYQ